MTVTLYNICTHVLNLGARDDRLRASKRASRIRDNRLVSVKTDYITILYKE